MGEPTVNELLDDDATDSALRALLHSADEPADAGFSLRVMAALPAPAAPRHLRWARWAERGRWAAMGLAAGGLAVLVAGGDRPLDGPHALAALALAGLLVFWSVPSRWSRP